MATPKPNIVLVHGAWADGSCWSSVIEGLQAKGYHVIAPQFPESSWQPTWPGCVRCSIVKTDRPLLLAIPTAGRS